MALPPPIVTAAGRTIYKNAKGRFISRAQYLQLRRRGPGGRFLSRQAYAAQQTVSSVASEIQAMMGPPIDGGSWVAKVQASFDRFRDLVDQ